MAVCWRAALRWVRARVWVGPGICAVGCWAEELSLLHAVRLLLCYDAAHVGLQDAAKRAEVKLREAQGGAEQQRTELTRARAEVLQLRQELAESTQQLLLIGRAQGAEAARQRGSGAGGAPAGCLLEGPSGASSDGGGGLLSQEVQETLAARLATAQVREQPVLQAMVLSALKQAVPKLLRLDTIGVDSARMSLTTMSGCWSCCRCRCCCCCLLRS